MSSSSQPLPKDAFPVSKHIPRYLRSALRVIHCLQKERGGSSLYAFKNRKRTKESSDGDDVSDSNRSSSLSHPAIINTRERTDSAILFFKESCHVACVSADIAASWESSLMDIRAQVDHDIQKEDGKDDDETASSFLSSYQFLSSYHRLIEHVIAISVVQVVTQEENCFDERNAQMSQTTIDEDQIMSTIATSEQLKEQEKRSKSVNILALIMSFVKLKESTGLERAILSSLMVIGDSISDLRLKLFSDLVVEEANQRSIVRELQEQTKYALNSDPDSAFYESFKGLMALVEHFVKPSPEMERLQNMINKEFDIEGLQSLMPVQQFWEMITLYIDQLHALELLFIEELQTSWTSSVEETETEIPQERNPQKESPLSITHLDVFPSITPPHSSKEWEIDLYEIEFRKRIGAGVGGTTYLARWSGGDVAVKVAAITGIGLEGWHTEVSSLQRLHHPNVIRLLGIFNNASPQTYGLVLEYCNAGDLSESIKRCTSSNFFWKVADDIVSGMTFLHKKNILHRDIKPGNVLLNGDVPGGHFTAKLTDFGVAIMHQGTAGKEHTAETGTYRWMAPEIIRHEAYSFMADVYSFALILWQLTTREEPFKGLSQLEAAGLVSVDNVRPPFATGTPELIEMLIERCWRENPDERLPFKQIGIELKEIHKALSEREKTWLSASYGHPVYEVATTLKVPDHGGRGEVARARSLTRHPVFVKPQRGLLPRTKSKSPTRKKEKMGLLTLFNKKK